MSDGYQCACYDCTYERNKRSWAVTRVLGPGDSTEGWDDSPHTSPEPQMDAIVMERWETEATE